MKLYKLTKNTMRGNTYYAIRVPREIAESFAPDQPFVIEKDSANGWIAIKPVSITVGAH